MTKKKTPAPPSNAVVFEPEFIDDLKTLFEQKIAFNQVLGLKITCLCPTAWPGRSR